MRRLCCETPEEFDCRLVPLVTRLSLFVTPVDERCVFVGWAAGKCVWRSRQNIAIKNTKQMENCV